jgi:Uma2 family endonuclease
MSGGQLVATTDHKLMTIEDVAALEDDGYQYELIRGELVRMPPSGFDHSDIGVGIGGELRRYARQHQLGRVTGADGGYVFERGPDTLLAPDAAFTREERLPPREQRQGFVAVVPDLIVEVVSPSDRARSVANKIAIYLGTGVREVWVVDPRQRTVTVHVPGQAPRTLGEDDQLDGGDILPGFVLPVQDVFA